MNTDLYETSGTSPPEPMTPERRARLKAEDRCPSFNRCDWLKGPLQRLCPDCQDRADAARDRENRKHAEHAARLREIRARRQAEGHEHQTVAELESHRPSAPPPWESPRPARRPSQHATDTERAGWTERRTA